MRIGSDYLECVRDGRNVYLDGEKVSDVTKHSAFSSQVRLIARIYDQAADASYAVPTSDHTSSYSAMWLIPRSRDDLAQRRRVHELWASGSYGLMGRTPDMMASFITGFAGGEQVFRKVDDKFADRVNKLHAWACEEDPYVSVVFVPPQIDRSKPAHQQPEDFLYAGVAHERDDGVIIRGAQMIGTAAVLSDYVFLSNIVPLRPGDEAYAISALIPAGDPNLYIYPRRPYADLANTCRDYPLSSQFDETDSMIVFRDVFVPWERVYAYRDIDLMRDQFHATGAHLLGNWQALVRFETKLDLAAGLGMHLARMHNVDSLPPVQAHLGGNVAAYCAAIKALTRQAEADPVERHGMIVPRPSNVYAAMSLQRRLVIDLMRSLRELAGGSFIAVPASLRSLEGDSPEAEDARRYFRGATVTAEERVSFLRLMWDFVGTEFAGRQLQYEMFYSAAQHVVDTRLFSNYEWQPCLDLVARCLEECGLGENARD